MWLKRHSSSVWSLILGVLHLILMLFSLAWGWYYCHLIGISHLNFFISGEWKTFVNPLVTVPIPLVDLSNWDPSKMLWHPAHILSSPARFLEKLIREVLNLLWWEDLILGFVFLWFFSHRLQQKLEIIMSALILHLLLIRRTCSLLVTTVLGHKISNCSFWLTDLICGFWHSICLKSILCTSIFLSNVWSHFGSIVVLRVCDHVLLLIVWDLDLWSLWFEHRDIDFWRLFFLILNSAGIQIAWQSFCLVVKVQIICTHGSLRKGGLLLLKHVQLLEYGQLISNWSLYIVTKLWIKALTHISLVWDRHWNLTLTHFQLIK